MGLRRHLIALIALALLPLTVCTAVLVSAVRRGERAASERSLREAARGLAVAVDRELQGSVAPLEALATARSLERGDLAAFYEDARRALRSQPDWLTVSLAGPGGEPLLDLLRPLGAALGPVADAPSLRRVRETARPAIGGLVVGPLTGIDEFAVRVPVIRDDRLAYVLTASVTPAVMARLLTEQRLPGEAVGWVLDPAGRTVARMPGDPELVGRPATAGLVPPAGARPERPVRARTPDGLEVYAAASPSARSGWTAALAVPVGAFEAPLDRSGVALAAGGGGALLLALGLTGLYGRWIGRAIGSLEASAASPPVGAPAAPPAPWAAIDPAARMLGRGGAPGGPLPPAPVVRGSPWRALVARLTR